jgi:hypothetical protein
VGYSKFRYIPMEMCHFLEQLFVIVGFRNATLQPPLFIFQTFVPKSMLIKIHANMKLLVFKAKIWLVLVAFFTYERNATNNRLNTIYE